MLVILLGYLAFAENYCNLFCVKNAKNDNENYNKSELIVHEEDIVI